LLSLIFYFLASFLPGFASAEIVWDYSPDAAGAGIVRPWYTNQIEVQQLAEKIAFSDKTTLSGMDISSASVAGITPFSFPGAFDGFDHGVYDKSDPEKNIFDLNDIETHESNLPIAEPASLFLLGIGMIALARFRSMKKRLYFIRSLLPETNFYGTFERFSSLLQRLSTEMKVPGITR
jgi:hypothetical protein